MMAYYHEKERDKTDYRNRDEENFGSLYSGVERVESPRLEHEKKLRREIANSNERRRMQSINAGFQSLRALLPKTEGDKLSKAAILQGTVDYLHQLEQEKSFLMSQNMKLSRNIQQSSSNNDSDGSCCNDLPLPKRKRRKIDLHLVDEGIGSASPSSQSDTECDARQEIAQLRRQLEHERAWRLRLEDELKEREGKGKAPDHDYTQEQDVKPKTSSHPLPPFHHLSPTKDNSSPLNLQISNPRPPPIQPYTYDANKPRQSLAAIVEAIRHVEGYHMFQDDSSPVNSPKSSSEETTIEGLSFESKIIRSAPVVQNRAGVIVSNTS